ncbi:MAG TPA: HAD-IA family hydrolase [Dehalococcoidia bacterium]|nr:HAD-IA family hydrolase [Dehalococcoidia bacterium]
MGNFRAIVFDLDGVLWDGEPLYHEAFNVVLKPQGCIVTYADYLNVIGYSVEAAWEWVLKNCGIAEPIDRFLPLYDAAVMELLSQPKEPLPGVRELLAELHARRIPVGLASASLRHWIDATLEGIGLVGQFQTTVAADEVEHAKPAPDLYLRAAANLGVDPMLCVAVEDTVSGVRSAKGAGMYVVQVRASSTALPPIAEADAVIEDFSQFDLGLFARK